MSQKSYFIKIKKAPLTLIAVLIFVSIHHQLAAQADTATELTKPVYYELVQENLKPEPDEFYVNSIFTIKKMPKVSIARSQNKRAGELYDSYVNYGIGDYITSDFKIENIDPKLKEVIVIKEATGEYYVLTMSYGTATSRLARIKNYKPNR